MEQMGESMISDTNHVVKSQDLDKRSSLIRK